MLIKQEHTLDKAFKEIHDQLKRAGVDTRHKFRFFSVATVGKSEHTIPHSRMVVLRSFSDDWSFEFYTDHRSSKIEEIRENSTISALFWNPSKRVQVRIEADASLHNGDEIAAGRWKDVQGDAQKAYTSTLSPGSPIDNPKEAHHWPDSCTSDNFTVIVCTAFRIKALQISGMEHLALESRRERPSDEWQKTWIVP